MFKRFLLSVVLGICLIGTSVSASGIRPVRVELSRQYLHLGDALKIDLFTISPITKSTAILDGKSFDFFQMPKVPNSRYHYVAYIGISRNQPTGKYGLKVFSKLRNGDSFHKKYSIFWDNPVQKTNGKVALNDDKKELSKDTSSLQKEAALIGEKFRTKTNDWYGGGRFRMPAEGRLSSEFGKVRDYNSGIIRRHAGADIANSVGTDVYAPESGRVILSEALHVHGETVMIDHGFGIVTIYNHLNKRFVVEGQKVKKGMLMGQMGATGLVSGPHLHWGMSVQNVRVDPLKWVN